MSLVSFPSWGVSKEDLRYGGGNIWFIETENGGELYIGKVEGVWNGMVVNGKKEGYWEYFHHTGWTQKETGKTVRRTVIGSISTNQTD